MADEKSFTELLKAVKKNSSDTKIAAKKALDQNKDKLSQLQNSIESQGGVAKDNLKYNKMQTQITKDEFDLRMKTATAPGAKKEIEKERSEALGKAIGKPLGKFGKGVMDGFKKLGGFFKDKASGAISGLGSLLKFGLMGAALFAVTTFLKSPTWAEWKDKLVPILLDAFNLVTDAIKWTGRTIMDGINAFRVLFGGLFDKDGKFVGISAAFTHLKENAGCIGPALAGLAVGFVGITTLIGGPKLIGKLGIGAVKLAIKGIVGGIPALTTAFGAIGSSLTTVGAALGGGALLGAATVVGAAAIFASLVKGVYEGVKAGNEEFKKTGDITESFKVGTSTFIAETLAFIPNLFLDLTAWVLKKFGWEEWAAAIGEIDLVTSIKESMMDLFDKIGYFIKEFYYDYIKPIIQPVMDKLKDAFDFLGDIFEPVTRVIKIISEKIGKIVDGALNFIGGIFTTSDEERQEKIKQMEKEKALYLQQEIDRGEDNTNQIERVENRIQKQKLKLGEITEEEFDANKEARKKQAKDKYLMKREEKEKQKEIPRLIEKENMKTIDEIPKGSNNSTTISGFKDEDQKNKMLESMGGTVITAPVSNVTNNPTTQMITKTIVEPDPYFLRQSNWAI